jgi:hypothetical protein
MDGRKGIDFWEAARQVLGAEGENLDRVLVAGLMLEVILESAGAPEDPQARRHEVKARLKDTMVAYLAGRVTLDRFRHLVRQVEHYFPVYYPLISAGWPGIPEARAARAPAAPVLEAPPAPVRGLREDLLRSWLQDESADLLPRRPHRKVNPDKLREFLRGTQGGWFRLKDFEKYFEVDRKTAWEYLQKFRHADLLRHNRRRSAAVRYALETRFLVVRAETLAPRVAEALADRPQDLAIQVCERLIATGGEAFPEAQWHDWLDPCQSRQILTCLEAAGVVVLTGGEKYRLRRVWLRD